MNCNEKIARDKEAFLKQNQDSYIAVKQTWSNAKAK